MKKIIMIGSMAFALATTFSACGYRSQTCGVDQCGNTYTDTTYRTYNSSNPHYPKNVKFSKDRYKNFVTPIPNQDTTCCPEPTCETPKNTPVLTCNKPLKISVVGQGVAPCTGTCSPAQAYAMAKRAAIADAYRLIAEKVKGVYVEGNDYIKNMMVKRSAVKTFVQATIRNANIIETTFKEGLCEVEMEITLRRSQLL